MYSALKSVVSEVMAVPKRVHGCGPWMWSGKLWG